ncbi:MAG: spore germination protein [Bacillota bacterium]
MGRNPLLNGDLQTNQQVIDQLLSQQAGFVSREVILPPVSGGPRRAVLWYLDMTVDVERLERHVILPMLSGREPESVVGHPARVVKDVDSALREMARGKVLAQTSDSNQVLALMMLKFPFRSVETPQTEGSVSGPAESFTESLTSNLGQIRRRFPSPDIRVESIFIGTRAPIQVVLVYQEGGPTTKMLTTVRERLEAVKQDGAQDLSQLAEALGDVPVSLFPSILTTERPDIVIQYITGGRIALLMENSPRALILPALLVDFFASADDFYQSRLYVSFLRFIRFVAFNMAIPLPAVYVSVTTYHLQALPTLLTLNLLTQREGAPLPPPIEALIMTIIFEILREASVRLPRAIGPTVSIVGGLVIGEAAIASGLTAPTMVLVVTATAVAAFSLPSPELANTATYYRFGLLLLSSAFGFFGLLLGYLVVLANVAGMTSLGVPYTAPFFPLQLKHLLYALGVKPKPPQGMGARPRPSLTQEAERFHEGEGRP